MSVAQATDIFTSREGDDADASRPASIDQSESGHVDQADAVVSVSQEVPSPESVDAYAAADVYGFCRECATSSPRSYTLARPSGLCPHHERTRNALSAPHGAVSPVGLPGTPGAASSPGSGALSVPAAPVQRPADMLAAAVWDAAEVADARRRLARRGDAAGMGAVATVLAARWRAAAPTAVSPNTPVRRVASAEVLQAVPRRRRRPSMGSAPFGDPLARVEPSRSPSWRRGLAPVKRDEMRKRLSVSELHRLADHVAIARRQAAAAVRCRRLVAQLAAGLYLLERDAPRGLSDQTGALLAVMHLSGDWRSGRGVRPGKDVAALLLGCTPQTVYNQWQVIEAAQLADPKVRGRRTSLAERADQSPAALRSEWAMLLPANAELPNPDQLAAYVVHARALLLEIADTAAHRRDVEDVDQDQDDASTDATTVVSGVPTSPVARSRRLLPSGVYSWLGTYLSHRCWSLDARERLTARRVDRPERKSQRRRQQHIPECTRTTARTLTRGRHVPWLAGQRPAVVAQVLAPYGELAASDVRRAALSALVDGADFPGTPPARRLSLVLQHAVRAQHLTAVKDSATPRLRSHIAPPATFAPSTTGKDWRTPVEHSADRAHRGAEACRAAIAARRMVRAGEL